ncbi:2-phospho-L-lactate guanylyltransferase [Cellulomonas composti]|uniref:Phosphoenolpyruvate guanylyltransferase n=1 Tax=Cellulomonas composti TaxID=266130 RepID=A0A511J6Q3_9CELL|nr:2-phospho-L-lactate guanylyltransferase [Cellulomonas composti]GEL93692.1 hypothetical protein CCO02nite_03500 [Cellulomonas composti]
MRELWSVVVPVKDAAAGKTRLGGVLDDRARTALVRAMALDTIAAAAACAAVGQVVVVTADEVVAREAIQARRPVWARAAGVRVVPEPSHAGARSGLDAAAGVGVAAARATAPSAHVGVLLGDLPTLRPADLALALDAAAAHERAMVADAPGTGTTLLTFAGGAAFDSRFGAGSAAAHAALGHVVLDVPAASTLRQDVDLPTDLEALRERHPGPRTARLLDRLAGDVPLRGAGRPA